ncbi:MAG TPA: ribosomal L7Ae/L30e/S12e/Gadd45 family protein [Gemmatimonadaceae bacterium]|nr:ribosomal L7Ae/L30e/S12e/Gadd45 family protein [Gemmatimonadaceae bacterium]
MNENVSKKVLGLAGLGVRGRLAVIGVERVREAAQKGKLKLAIVARDASKNSLDKIVPLLDAKRVRIIDGIGAAALGAAVGRDATAVVGIVDAQLAKGIRGVVDSAGQPA